MSRKSAAPFSRLGIVDQSSDNWSAGGTYTKMLLSSLARPCRAAGIELVFLTKRATDIGSAPPPYRVCKVKKKGKPPLHRRILRVAEKPDIIATAEDEGISVLLPVYSGAAQKSPVRTIGWLPDFQHVRHPEWFSKKELAVRNQHFLDVSRWASLVMLSSESAKADFVSFTPEFAHKARVLPFPSLFAFEAALPYADSVRSRFHLPDKFALVANQFWQHKNHLTVIDAVALARDAGESIPVVMTGLPSDYRDPKNSTISRVLQSVALSGLGGQIIILGQVEYLDLIALMRAASVIIQPSRFEGWSTVVQDAKALGRPVICSDISVHREQAPHALGYFDCDDFADLQRILCEHWDHLTKAPDFAAEQVALACERAFAEKHGATLLEICREAVRI